MRAARISIVVLVASLAASVAPAQAAFPGTNGRLAFSDVRPPNPNTRTVFSINPDGSGLIPLTNNPSANDVGPGWSADGTKIAYASQNTGFFASGVRVMNYDGSNDHFVTSFGSASDNPTWSPDGTRIAYNGTATGLRIVNADGTGDHALTIGTGPAWSPDGTKIAYSNTASGRTDVYTVNPDGTGVTNLTGDAASGSISPDWAPDNSKIVYVQGGGIWTMDADGGNKTLIKFGSSPVWSPDGSRIAYTTGGAIHTMDVDGANDTLVLSNSANGASGLDWEACTGTCPDPTVPYDVPGVADRAYIKFVPSYRQTISDTQCTSRGGTPSTHGAPLALNSCFRPAYLPGTVAHQGPYGESGVIYTRGDGFGGGNNELNITGGGTDIRNAANGDYNPAPGRDATLFVAARITDTYNGPNLDQPATVTDADLGFQISCTPDSDPLYGSTCAGSTSLQGIVPGAIVSGRHTVVQLFEVQMKDIGTDGVLGNADDRSFTFQGVSIP